MLLRSRIAWLGLVVFLSTVVSAYAQAKPAQPGPYPPPAPPYPTAEVTGGYQLLHVPDQTFPFGLNLDGAWNTSKALGIVGEVGWTTDSENDFRVHVWNIGAGPRFNARPMGGRVWPYGQVLAGITHVRGGGFSDTHFMLQPGAGVNVNAGDGWGVVFQGDYRRVFLNEEEFGESGQNQFRFFAGIRLLLD
ncbi:MAG TPA: outer membrane beta-barrel protein [Vicinamibacterales bacterium]|jgi:hypothetical protein|nr:outer membrane beta-barrel protein [Vicinamibacterales bacterium]